ncbi:MAG: hypothetical protein VX275_13820, partial [Pseudomonadota bacterium]|nr:hypothetical protein [Pseudomonadota bacterium]
CLYAVDALSADIHQLPISQGPLRNSSQCQFGFHRTIKSLGCGWLTHILQSIVLCDRLPLAGAIPAPTLVKANSAQRGLPIV